MRLHELPAELLAAILDYDVAAGPIELWKSGCGVIRTKLANSGVLRVDLRAVRAIEAVYWPKCLRHFKLRHLSFKATLSVSYGRKPQEELALLHKGLLSLEISHYGAFDVVFGHDRRAQRTVRMKRTYPPIDPDDSEEDTDCLEEDDVSFNFGAHFDKLEHLKIGGTPECPLPATSRFFARLPRSLTSLDFTEGSTLQHLTRFTNLPPNLVIFKLPAYSIDEQLIHYLPKQLEDLGYCFTSEACHLLWKQPQMLPNLKRFPMAGELDDEDQWRGTPCPARSTFWDDHQTELHFSSYSSHRSCVELPKYLVQLTIEGTPRELELDKLWVQTILPRTVEDLSCEELCWEDLEANDWPTNLTSLRLSYERHMDWYDFIKLPRSLKKLSVTYSWYDGDEVSPVSDDQFATLLQNGRTALSLESGKWSELRHKLTGYRADPRISEMERLVESVERGGLFGLPLGLERLGLPPHLYERTESLFITVPPLVRVLELIHVPKSQNFVDCLPPSITSLTLSEPDYGEDGWSTLIDVVSDDYYDNGNGNNDETDKPESNPEATSSDTAPAAEASTFTKSTVHFRGLSLVSAKLKRFEPEMIPVLLSILPASLLSLKWTDADSDLDDLEWTNLPPSLRVLIINKNYYDAKCDPPSHWKDFFASTELRYATFNFKTVYNRK